jgi:hypothetical protein
MKPQKAPPLPSQGPWRKKTKEETKAKLHRAEMKLVSGAGPSEIKRTSWPVR